MLLITGITGHSGRYFLQELIDNNYQGPIRCIVRSNSNIENLKKSGLNIEVVIGDLDDQAFLYQAFEGITDVFHIASIFYSVSVTKAAVRNNVKNLYLVHTTGIYSQYKSASEEYLKIENEVEILIKDTTIRKITLRPTMIYGYLNDQNMIVFIKMVDKLRVFPVINNGSNTIQPVNGRDLGKAYYQVLISTNLIEKEYILSGKSSVSMKELFLMISQLLNKKTKFVNVPLRIGENGAKSILKLSMGKIDYVERVQRMAEDRSYSHENAKRDFDYNPMPLNEGLSIEINEYLKSLGRV